MTSTRGLIYARVSTEEQKKDGTSIPKQLERDLAYNQAHDIETVGDRWYDLKQKRSVAEPNADCFADADGRPVPVYVDDYTGTVPIEQRPEGSRAYGKLTSGDAESLTVFSIDRLVRPKEDGDEWDIPILIRSLAKSSKAIHTVESGKIDNTFVGLLIAVVGGKGAGDERRKILDRMADGKARKARELKKWVGTGRAPYGYTKIGKGKDARLEINPHEARLVRRMFDLYLGLNGETAIGLMAIAALFNREGLPTTGRMLGKKNQTKKDHVWRAGTVSGILSNRVYLGEFTWSGEVVTIPTLAIIPREIFDAAQARRSTNKIESKRNVKHDYLLRGRILCNCGLKLSAEIKTTGGRDYPYYRCHRRTTINPSSACDGLTVAVDVADRVAWDWLIDVFKNPEKLLEGIREYQARQRETAEPQRARMAELPGLIADCEKQAKGLTVSLSTKNPDDPHQALAIKALEDSLAQVSAAHKRYMSEQEKVAAELAALEIKETDIQQVLAWAAELTQALDNDTFSFDAKRKVFERLNVTAQVEYQDGERGLRLNCAVLSYASKWQPLTDYSSRLFNNNYTQIMPQYTISGWVSLADEFFKSAGRVPALCEVTR